jgi:type IV pilus assembly protein PilM
MARLPDHVGLDFGTHSVKAIELRNISSKTPDLVNFGSQATPHGVVNSADEQHQKQLADAVKELYDSSKIREKNVVLAIPESAVFTRFLELPGVKDNEIESAVFYQTKEFLPIPVEQVQMSFIKVGFNKDKNAPQVLVVAAPKKIVEIYMNIMEMAGLVPIAIETESIATGRAMYRAQQKKQLVMLDFGANSTDMSIMTDGFLVFSQSISIGSDALTQAIINQFGFEYVQAEEYKRNYGLVPDALEGRVYSTLKPIMDSIITEVQRGVEFYKSKTLMAAPKDYVFVGDAALLPGLTDYFNSAINVNSIVADPFTNITVPNKFKAVIDKKKASFTVATGLALKNEV